MIVRLNGGLGNQMFQYAFGTSVSRRRGEPVFFHKYGLDSGPRAYGLAAFNTCVEFAEPSGPEYYEPSFAFCPDVYTTRANYFCGNWQTEKYFDEEVVREDLIVPFDHLGFETLETFEFISGSPSCFVHVRRTDYLIESTMKYHGSMTLDYYNEAMNLVIEREGPVRFYIFSDDTEWCKEHFKGNRFHIIDHNKAGNGNDGPGREHEDLFLMSACDHAIIPNSSFGWWGAWLSPKETARQSRAVIAPKNWFAPGGTAKHLDTKDICPDRWIRL